MDGENRRVATRQDVLTVLIEGDFTAGEIRDRIDGDVYVATVIQRLEDGGWIGKYRKGGETTYELSPLSKWMSEMDIEDVG